MKLDKKKWIDESMLRTTNRLLEIQSAMALANEGLINDTKSSMGDKYETSREMAQQELSRLQQQLLQAEQDLVVLKNLSLEPLVLANLGSLVVTNQFNYLLSISIGPVKLGDNTVMVISKESPIGKALLGKRIADVIQFNGKEIKVLDLL